MDLEYMNIKGEITMTFKEKLFIDHPEYINDTDLQKKKQKVSKHGIDV